MAVVRRYLNQNPAMARPGVTQGVRVGTLLVTSGQVARDLQGDGAYVGRDDPAAQAEQCLDNLEALLAVEGAGLDAVVKLTCYAVSRAAYEAYAAAKKKRFAGRPMPAGTTVLVAGLVDERLLLEVEALAVLDA